MAESEILK